MEITSFHQDDLGRNHQLKWKSCGSHGNARDHTDRTLSYRPGALPICSLGFSHVEDITALCDVRVASCPPQLSPSSATVWVIATTP